MTRPRFHLRGLTVEWSAHVDRPASEAKRVLDAGEHALARTGAIVSRPPGPTARLKFDGAAFSRNWTAYVSGAELRVEGGSSMHVAVSATLLPLLVYALLFAGLAWLIASTLLGVALIAGAWTGAIAMWVLVAMRTLLMKATTG